MVDSPTRPDANLAEFLSARARTSSDGRLAVNAAAGLVIAAVAIIWRPAGWHLITSAAICFLTYGAWGIADRELREREAGSPDSVATTRLLRLGRGVAAGLGALAAGALLISLLGVALGTWIS